MTAVRSSALIAREVWIQAFSFPVSPRRRHRFFPKRQHHHRKWRASFSQDLRCFRQFLSNLCLRERLVYRRQMPLCCGQFPRPLHARFDKELTFVTPSVGVLFQLSKLEQMQSGASFKFMIQPAFWCVKSTSQIRQSGMHLTCPTGCITLLQNLRWRHCPAISGGTTLTFSYENPTMPDTADYRLHGQLWFRQRTEESLASAVARQKCRNIASELGKTPLLSEGMKFNGAVCYYRNGDTERALTLFREFARWKRKSKTLLRFGGEMPCRAPSRQFSFDLSPIHSGGHPQPGDVVAAGVQQFSP